MQLEQLKLFQFRCYEHLELSFDPRFNVISGLNGQGKTSILEAMGLLTSLRSFRNAKNAEMVRFGEKQSRVSGNVMESDLQYRLDVNIISNKKTGMINGKVCRYISEYLGKIPSVTFSPTDLEIIRGAPEYRRHWMDRVSQICFPEHLDLYSRYQKTLDHRNKELRLYSEGRSTRLPDDFEVWTEQLVDSGAQIIHNRIHTVDNFGDKIEKYYGEIAREKNAIKLNYLTGIFEEVHGRQVDVPSLQGIRTSLQRSLLASLPKEKILGTTWVGPHRDDFEVQLDGNSIKAYGSQGEVRSLVLAMRLAEVELQKILRRRNPLLLIDDFSSELDAKRRQYLLNYLIDSGSQIFLTTTEAIDLGKVFRISEAKLAIE